jgi:hypothetical protein
MALLGKASRTCVCREELLEDCFQTKKAKCTEAVKWGPGQGIVTGSVWLEGSAWDREQRGREGRRRKTGEGLESQAEGAGFIMSTCHYQVLYGGPGMYPKFFLHKWMLCLPKAHVLKAGSPGWCYWEVVEFLESGA